MTADAPLTDAEARAIADNIVRTAVALEAERDRLREALKVIVSHETDETECDAACADDMIRVAREALEESHA